MEFFETVAKRHSYRGPFRDRRIPRDDLRRIVEAGLMAPSGKNEQTTTFVIVDEPDLVRRIAEIPGGNKAVQFAKAFIVCVVDREPQAVYEGLSFQVEDCAAAVENLLLAITAMGYASVWVDGWVRTQGRADIIGELLGIPKTKTARILLPVGVPEKEVISAVQKKPFDQRAWFNRHGEF